MKAIFVRMGKSNLFLKQYLDNKKEVGAIAPSSKFLRNRMMSPVNFHRSSIIIELGAGNGVFTKEILKRMRPESKLFVFETNASFFEKLSSEINDSRITIFNESAEHLHNKMKEIDVKQVDAIISSLPYAVFPQKVKNKILDNCISSLAPDGVYVQFQYSLNAHKLLKTKFSRVTLDFTPINMPPAFIYRCKP
jgi:phosphatidylethanolamine/phosphatidyl-N-methylethanolamine N-methyltransferase